MYIFNKPRPLLRVAFFHYFQLSSIMLLAKTPLNDSFKFPKNSVKFLLQLSNMLMHIYISFRNSKNSWIIAGGGTEFTSI